MLLPTHISWQGKAYTLAAFQSFLSQQLTKETLLHWERCILDFAAQWCSPHIQQFKLHTSGSTGAPKAIVLSRQAMKASAQATGKALHLTAGQSVLLCLSAEYIAGIMMIVRAIELGLDLYYVQPKADFISRIERTYDLCSVVPLQLQYAIDHRAYSQLNLLRTILVGGDALPASYFPPLQKLSCSVLATYGMTETITHIALRHLNGMKASAVYHCLDGVNVYNNAKGCLCLSATHLNIKDLQTNDIAAIHSSNSFSLLGRADFVINSGGLKIHPQVVEEVLSAIIPQSFVLSAMSHPRLGKAAVLLIEKPQTIDAKILLAKAKAVLPAYQAPKAIFYTSALARKANGKIDRRACEEEVERLNI